MTEAAPCVDCGAETGYIICVPCQDRRARKPVSRISSDK